LNLSKIIGNEAADVRLGFVERVAEHDVQLAPHKDVFAGADGIAYIPAAFARS